MPVDPQCRAILDLIHAPGAPDLATLPPQQIRQMADAAIVPGTGQPVARVEERAIPGPDGDLRVRVYTPQGRRPRSEATRAFGSGEPSEVGKTDISGPLPGIVYFHGGGFVYCSLDTHDGTCRALANASGCVVMSVDYRLAPEHTYPAAPQDGLAAVCFAAERGGEIGIDRARIAVAGDSAGGNLATVVALMARDRGGPAIGFQLLVYPICDFSFETRSYRDNAEGYLLTEKMMRAFWGHYLADEAHGAESYASPLRAENLAGLPPAWVVTAEFDPLRDECEAYAARLADAGVDTQLRRYDGMIHGFFSMGDTVDKGRLAVEDAGRALRAQFQPGRRAR